MASSQEHRPGIVRLNATNYQNWKFGAEMLLLKEDLWQSITNIEPTPTTAEWRRKDDAARATIALSMEPSLHYLISDSPSARDTWARIKVHFERIGFSSRIFLKKKLLNIRLEGNDMNKYISEITNIVERLRCGGTIYEDSEVISTLLCGLPEAYDGLIMGLEAREESSLSLENVKLKLMDESERKRENLTQDQRIMTTIQGNRGYTQREMRCYNCRGLGHFKNKCPEWRRPERSYNRQQESRPDAKYRRHYPSERSHNQEEPSETHYSLNLNEVRTNQLQELSEYLSYTTTERDSEMNQEHTWVLDSGATSHMSYNRDLLFNYKDFSHERSVIFANGTRCTALGEGDMELMGESTDDTSHVLHSVILVPELKVSLLSVSKLCSSGYNILFETSACQISLEGKNVVKGQIKNGIYNVETTHRKPQINYSTCIHGWHRRLGHRSLDTIKQMSHNNEVLNLKIDNCKHDNFCDVCVQCDLKQRTFKKITDKQSSRPFQLIHTDLCGPIEPTSRGGGNYILLITDDFSRYSFLEIIKYKSDTTNTIIAYLKHFHNKFGYWPTDLRSDQGGEFNNFHLNNFLNANGIHHQLSVSHTPQQNGISERVNRTIIQMTKSMLVDQQLPRNLWGEAASTACYLHNRIIHSSTGKTPYFLWEGKKPNLEHLRTMGSTAYSHISKHNRKKLDDNSQVGILLGYSGQHKAYRILNGDNKIIVSTSIAFNENECNGQPEAAPEEQFFEFDPLPTEIVDDTKNEDVQIRRSERKNKGTIPIRYRD